MRILIVGSTFTPALNGQAVFTGSLAQELAKRGHKVYAIVPSDQGRAYQDNKYGMEIQYLRTVNLHFLHPEGMYTPFYSSEINQAIKYFKPEIIHIQDHYPICSYTTKVAKRFGIKIIGTNHFMPENLAPIVPYLSIFGSAFNWVAWRWMLSVFNQLDLATAPSKTAADIIKKRGVIPPVYPVSCGVSLERFHPDPLIDRKAIRRKWGLHETQTTFLFVGRVDGEKKLNVVIHALSILDRKDIQFAIVGNGAAVHGLKHLAASLNLEDQIHFTGFVPTLDLPALLNSVEVFTMPSEAELLSIATLEAMACGLPILAANSQALPELVSTDLNGYLFEPGNIYDAARCMALLADHPSEWPRMSTASLDKVQPHSLENTICNYEKLYENLLTSIQPLTSFEFSQNTK